MTDYARRNRRPLRLVLRNALTSPAALFALGLAAGWAL